MSAVISDCGTYRYLLERDTDMLGDGTVAFVLLNPSTADAETDDPTVRRCRRFARDWGYARLAIINLFAYRATDPKELPHAPDPVGPLNDEWIRVACEDADRVVCAWGVNGTWRGRDLEVRRIIAELGPHYLRLTAGGHPQHPLYLPATLLPIPWR